MAKFLSIPFTRNVFNILISQIENIAAKNASYIGYSSKLYSKLALSDYLVILPNHRSIREFNEFIRTQGNLSILPSILSYSDLADNMLELISREEKLSEIELLQLPNTFSKSQLNFAIYTDYIAYINKEGENCRLKTYESKDQLKFKEAELAEITRALSEYYHNQYDLELLKSGSDKEQLLSYLIENLKQRGETDGVITEQQRQVIAAQRIEKILSIYKKKTIFALLPANNTPYIKQIVKAISKLENSYIFIQGLPSHSIAKTNQEFHTNRIKPNTSQQSLNFDVSDSQSSFLSGKLDTQGSGHFAKFSTMNVNQKHYTWHIVNHLSALINNKDDVLDVACEVQTCDFNNILELFISQILCLPELIGNLIETIQHEYVAALDHVEIVEAKSQMEEAKIICNAVQIAMQEDENARIAIVTNNREIIKIISALLDAHVIRYNDSTPMQHEQSHIIQLFILILKAATEGSSDFKIWLSLFKHPSSIVFEELRESVYMFEKRIIRHSEYTQNIDSYFKLYSKNNLSCDIEPLRNYYERIMHFRDVMQKTSAFDQVLTAHFETFCHLIHPKARESQHFYILEELVHSTTSNPVVTCNLLFKEDYNELLKSLLKNLELRKFEKTEPCVEILTPMEARFLKFDFVIAAGMQESFFPSYLIDHGYISQEVRAKKNGNIIMKDVEIGYAAFDFAHLLAQKRVLFSYSKSSKSGVLQASRFIDRLIAYIRLMKKINLDDLAYHSKVRAEYSRIPRHSAKRPIFKIAALASSCTSSLNIDVNEIMPSKISVSGIERLMKNPYLYYVHDVLKLRPLEPIPTPGISKKRFGIILHDLLSNAVEKAISSVDDLVSLFYSKFGAGTSDQLKQQVLEYFFKDYINQVADLFLCYQEKNLNSVKQSITEVKGVIKFLTGDGKLVCVTAIADRVDLLKNGDVKIIDYKTGNIPSSSEIKRGIAPQLLIEGLIYLYGDAFGIKKQLVQKKDVDLYYISLHRKSILNERIIKCDFPSTYDALTKLINKFFTHDAVIFPSMSATKSYERELYSHISRDEEWLGR